MTFASYTFVVFLLIVWGGYRLPLPWTVKKCWLLMASYVFYGAWNPKFLVLLWLSTGADYYLATAIEQESRPVFRRIYLIVSLVSNLGMLAYFKYGGMLLRSGTQLAEFLGFDVPVPVWDVVLPVGISFYTFQSLSYVLDMYLRRHPPASSLLDFALYVTFFPQLVAGPIVRADEFLPQCHSEPPITSRALNWGVVLIIIGIFQKTVLADGVFAPVVESVYDQMKTPSLASAWIGSLAFSGQIYCDFSGYSLCAIGTALLFGISLPDNFRCPYGSLGFSDFWRRWHISLSTWLRDYLYIPLGGNRNSAWRTQANLMLTMLLGGIWHGANWTFVVWGGMHGLFLIAERFIRSFDERRGLRLMSRPGVPFLVGAVTFSGVNLAWVFFRARTFSGAYTLLMAMLGRGGAERVSINESLPVLVCIGLLLLLHGWFRDENWETITHRIPGWLLGAGLGTLLLVILMQSGDDRAFIYFQF